MVKRSRKRKAAKQASWVGALLIESLAVVVMLGLFFVVQQERNKASASDELIRPTVMDGFVPACPHCVFREQPVYSVLEVNSEHDLTIERGFAKRGFESALRLFQ